MAADLPQQPQRPRGPIRQYSAASSRSPPLSDSASSLSPEHGKEMTTLMTSSTSTAIPIPRNASGFSPHLGARSPSSSSVSSYRSHPYSRQTSQNLNQAMGTGKSSPREVDRDALPRIQLPPPNSRDRIRIDTTPSGSYPKLSALNLHSPQDRLSEFSTPTYSSSAFQLQSIFALSGSGTAGPSSSKHGDERTKVSLRSPPIQEPLRTSPQVRPGMGPLRPSYTGEQQHAKASLPQQPPSSKHLASPWNKERDLDRFYDREYSSQRDLIRDRSRDGSDLESPHSSYVRDSPHSLPARHTIQHPPPQSSHQVRPQHPLDTPELSSEPPSPPLRALPSGYTTSPRQHPYFSSRVPRFVDGRARSHSATATVPGRAAPSPVSGSGSQNPGTAGQNRRLAHLMSEQKRRESINFGFNALRQVLPTSLQTDSKAVILQKAVSHIKKLENVLHRSGVRVEDLDVSPSEGYLESQSPLEESSVTRDDSTEGEVDFPSSSNLSKQRADEVDDDDEMSEDEDELIDDKERVQQESYADVLREREWEERVRIEHAARGESFTRGRS